MKDEILRAIATLRGDENATPSDILKIIRVSKGINQTDLADSVNVTRSTISAIEAGINKPSVELAKRIGEVLSVDWSLFF